MQRSKTTLYPPGQRSTPIRRRIGGELWGVKYFFTIEFLATSIVLKRRKSVECVFYWTSNSWRVTFGDHALTSYLIIGELHSQTYAENIDGRQCAWSNLVPRDRYALYALRRALHKPLETALSNFKDLEIRGKRHVHRDSRQIQQSFFFFSVVCPHA